VRRKTCGGCGSDENLETFLDLGETPLANSYPKTSTELEPFYPLKLGVCTECWLVQQMEVVPDERLFAVDYGFYSGASFVKTEYHRDLADRLMATHGDQARRLTVEIACNDGDLLQHLRDAGCRTLGVDPASGPVAVARERGLDVILNSFGARLAGEIRAAHGAAGLIIANHVVAHVADLDDFFSGVAALLAVDGALVVEVQYLVDLLVGNQYDHVYHEHRYHFSVSSLEQVAQRYGLYVHSVRHTPAQSGSISVVMGRTPIVSAELDRIRLTESWLRDPKAYHGFQGRVEHIRMQLLELVSTERRAGRRVAGYAAPAKATTLLNFCGIGPDTLEFVVDTTPQKTGLLIPGVHVPIIAPSGYEVPDTFILLAHNYAAGIMRREREFAAAGGRFIIPVPVPVLL